MFVFKTILTFLKDPGYRSLLFASFLVVVVGTVFYHLVEGWRILDSLYFSVITLATIGYGDFSPQTDLGKGFTIVYILVGVGLILSFINSVYYHFNEETKKGRKKGKKEKKLK